LAQHRLEADDPAGARVLLEEVHRITPEDEEVAPLLARLHIARAEVARRAGRSDEALQSIEAALQLQPELVEGLRLQVPLLVEQRRYAEAEETLARLQALEPQNPRYLVALGNVQRASGRPEAAVTTWRTALERIPAAEDAQLRPVLERLISETLAVQR
jgi:tetratricopeptide (TPR) repeat protein